jgi:hypothetical protein
VASKEDPKNALLAGGQLTGDAVAEAAALTREMNANRETTRRIKEQERPALQFIPIDESEREAAWDSAEWLDKRNEDEAKVRQELRDAENAKYRFYLKCRQGVHVIGGRPAQPHGIYFKQNPSSNAVGDHDWKATYKPTFEEIWRQPILCQVCLKMGQENPLPYEVTDYRRGLWRPDLRWVWKTPLDRDVWLIEGDTRGNDLPTMASNLWREDLEKKHAEHAAKKAALVQKGA